MYYIQEQQTPSMASIACKIMSSPMITIRPRCSSIFHTPMIKKMQLSGFGISSISLLSLLIVMPTAPLAMERLILNVFHAILVSTIFKIIPVWDLAMLELISLSINLTQIQDNVFPYALRDPT